MMSNLAELVRELEWARRTYSEGKAEEERLASALEQTPQWVKLKEERMYLIELKEAESAAEAALREAALATGDKQPHPAVQVKSYKVVNILDEMTVLRWATMGAPEALKLDKRVIERAAKAIDVPGTQVVEEQRATIASDLSEYLDA